MGCRVALSYPTHLAYISFSKSLVCLLNFHSIKPSNLEEIEVDGSIVRYASKQFADNTC